MDELIGKRLAFLRGYPHDHPAWIEMYSEVGPLVVKNLGVDNALDLLMLSIDDGESFDARLNKAWYSATCEQAEKSLSYNDDYDYYPYDYEDFNAPVDAWELEDREQTQKKEPEPDVDLEYRAFVRRYKNVWRAGHERRRLKPSHKRGA